MLKIDTHAHILPPDWPNLAGKYGDERFPVMVNADGRHRIYKDGKFFREVWANAFDPEVRIDGGLATVWAEYTFRVNDTISHCGVDAFQLVRTGDGWKILFVSDTRRTTGCRS